MMPVDTDVADGTVIRKHGMFIAPDGFIILHQCQDETFLCQLPQTHINLVDIILFVVVI